MKIRTLIVDDMPLSRERTRRYLAEVADVEIVGECADGEQTLAAIDTLAPDLLLLDVQMPGMTGLALLEKIPAQRRPAVVFVTAFDEFAVPAFAAHAVDFLLKPFDRERLAQVLQRVRAYLAEHQMQPRRKLNRYAANLALAADTAMLTLGGKLKFKEKISARLGDVLSNLYIASAMLKRYEDQGRPVADQPLLAWAFHDCAYRMQSALDGVLRNFPIRPVAWLLRALIFPIGRREAPPSDRLGHRVATILCAPNDARARLAEWIYLTPSANNPVGRMNALLPEVIAAEPVERKFAKALKAGAIKALDADAQLAEAEKTGALSAEERRLLERVRAAAQEFIDVDDFDPAELRAATAKPKPELRSVA